MRLDNCDSIERSIESALRSSPVAWAAVAFLVISCSWCVGDEPLATSDKTGGATDLFVDEEVLRYLPDDCRVFGQMNIAPILASPFMRNLSSQGADPVKLLSVPLEPIGLKIDDLERMSFGARHYSTDAMTQYVAVLFCRDTVDLPAAGQACEKNEIGKYTVWTPSDRAIAFCKVGEKKVLLGEFDTLCTVLHRDRPARLPDSERNSWQLTRSHRQFVVSLLPPQGQGWSQYQVLPVPGDFLKSVEALGLDIEFEKDLKFQVSALCGDQQMALELCNIVTGLCALARFQDLGSQMPQYRKMVDSVECAAEGPVVVAKMTVPNSLIQIAPSYSATLASGSGTPLARPNAPALAPHQSSTCPTTGLSSVDFGASTNPPSCAPYHPTTPNGGPGMSGAVPSPYGQPVSSTPYGYSPNCAPKYYAPPANFAASSPLPVALTKPRLEIADVVRLVDAGVAEGVIIRFVGKHQLKTALTVNDLIQLTEQEVATKIISTLQDLSVASKPKSAEPVPSNSTSRLTPR